MHRARRFRMFLKLFQKVNLEKKSLHTSWKIFVLTFLITLLIIEDTCKVHYILKTAQAGTNYNLKCGLMTRKLHLSSEFTNWVTVHSSRVAGTDLSINLVWRLEGWGKAVILLWHPFSPLSTMPGFRLLFWTDTQGIIKVILKSPGAIYCLTNDLA